MYWYVKNTLELMEYNHYEISNFAKKEYESKHNLNCWEQKEYIGLGIAAHSYIDGIRYSNTINLEEYIEAEFKSQEELNEVRKLTVEEDKETNEEECVTIKEKKLNKLESRVIEEVQSLEDKKNEYMLLGFRKIEGVNIAKFKEKFIDNPIFLYRDKLNKLVEEGLIEIDLNSIRLTRKGIDFANLVFEKFV